MNTRRTPARRIEENVVHEEIPPQVPKGAQGDQVPIMEGGSDVLVVPSELNNREIIEAFLSIALVVTTQVKFEYGA